MAREERSERDIRKFTLINTRPPTEPTVHMFPMYSEYIPIDSAIDIVPSANYTTSPANSPAPGANYTNSPANSPARIRHPNRFSLRHYDTSWGADFSRTHHVDFSGTHDVA